jgi:predicted RNase H-like nuclease
MLAGEAMFAALRRDYPLFDGSPPTGRVSLETFPQAVACALAGEIVSAQTKGVVRRTLIAQAGLPVAEFRNIDEIDAALCSIAAASLVSGTFRAYGDLAGGFIVVPKRPD